MMPYPIDDDEDDYINDPLGMDEYIKRKRRLALLSQNPEELGPLGGQVPIGRQPIDRSELYGLLNQSGGEIDALKQHYNQMPQRQPESTGRSIATALIAGAAGYGGGAERGINVASTIRDHQYNKDLVEWRQKGAGLEDIANLTTRKAGVLGKIQDYQERDSDRDEDRERKIEEEKNRHAENMAKIQTVKDETARKALENQETARYRNAIVADRNRRTDAYSKRLDNIGEPTVNQQRQAEQDAVKIVIGSDPQFAAFAKYGNYNTPYVADPDKPEEQQQFQFFLTQVQRVAKRLMAERKGKAVVEEPPADDDNLEFEP